jgi:hypothetical protein
MVFRQLVLPPEAKGAAVALHAGKPDRRGKAHLLGQDRGAPKEGLRLDEFPRSHQFPAQITSRPAPPQRRHPIVAPAVRHRPRERLTLRTHELCEFASPGLGPVAVPIRPVSD